MPRQRHIPLQGQVNFRDLGGYQTKNGETVKWGHVYRSGRLPKLSDQDISRLKILGIRTVVNLLTVDDMEVYGQDRLPDGVQEIALRIHSTTVTELANMINGSLQTGDFSKVPIELNPEIHRLLIHDGKQEYAALLREIADPMRRPIVFHCSHGIHRTGTGAAILLSALGVPWDTIRQDYLLSNQYRHTEVQKRLAQLRHLAADKRNIEPQQVDMTNMEAFLIQDGSYVDASRDEMIDEYGSIEGNISQGLGLNDDQIQHLRDELLV